MMSMIELYYRILRHDPEGKLIRDTGLVPSHSFVIQFLEFLRSLWKSADKTATDVDGAETIMVDVSDGMGTKGRCDAPVGDDAYGIVVGTNAGTTAVGNENYALDTKILHSGIGDAGKLNYKGVGVVNARVVGPNIDLDVSRTFANETGNTITVKEAGIIIKNSTDTKYHMILRDVVADEDVLDGETLTVVYTLRTTA